MTILVYEAHPIVGDTAGEAAARLGLWLCFHVMVGLLPAMVYWWLKNLDPDAGPIKRNFYWEGAFLFLGPAITGALCAELTVAKHLLGEQGLSTIALLFMTVVSFVSAITYGYMLTKREEQIESLLSIVREVSDAVLISSAVFAFSVTAVLYSRVWLAR